jgi:hypothetical protein
MRCQVHEKDIFEFFIFIFNAKRGKLLSSSGKHLGVNIDRLSWTVDNCIHFLLIPIVLRETGDMVVDSDEPTNKKIYM